MNNNRPWDAQLAFFLVYSLRKSRISPNHLTTIRLLFGVLAAILLSVNDHLLSNLGALCFVISNFLDHADGELARLSNKMSRTGHYYDLASDAIVNIILFLGIGIGLSQSDMGLWALLMGILVGISVAAIFYMRNIIENTIGKTKARQPHFARFEAEDVLYLLPLITYFEWLMPFLIFATIGAPTFSLLVLRKYTALNA
tara:strand:+ start:7785 stop:8381 length:597 start_codon:yes stop_codon:yes gene_type:complete